MTTNSNLRFTPPRVRRLFCLLFFVAAGIATLAATGSSRALGQRAGGNSLNDISAAVPVPVPPQCPLCCCWKPVEFGENFDGVTPPTLPPGWIATNVQGPPPLWVTSNSGLPSPPADTLPNAAFIDDPAVISDKLLDLPGLTVFEALSPS